MIVRTSVLATLFLTASLFAASDTQGDRTGEIQSKLNTIINKAGIHFNGTFRSQYLYSGLDVDNSGDSTIDWKKKKSESVEFTSVDFDIGARPNEALSARCMFRMHQNWQNFFSDVANPIFLRWLSIDGNVKDMFRFNVGNYRSKYSPLTLWSPDIEIPYEPEIFAEKRRLAMSELFLGNNDRLLQGINLNFDAELFPVLNELHVNVQANRLRLSETSNTNGSAPMALFDEDTVDQTYMDRYVVSENIDLVALRGLKIGGTMMNMFDLPSTNNVYADSAALYACKLMILGFRLAPSTKIFLDGDRFEAGLNLELATSNDRDSAWYEGADSVIKSTSAKGMAMDAGLGVSLKIGAAGKIKLNAGFMNNDAEFRNDMAQSPTFFGQRIMNVENDYAHNARLYTTFDALYDYVFKFTPSGNNKWTKEPRRKISYLNAILSPNDAAAVDGVKVRLDPALQMVLPFGAATPNRSGLKGDLSLKLFDNGVDVGVKFASLNEVEPEIDGGVKTAFTQFGAGLSIDIATWAKVLNCMKWSFGYTLEGASDKADAAGFSSSYTSGFLNAGLYYNFWQRFSLLAGLQQIVGTDKSTSSVLTTTTTITQTQWAAGLEYKVSEGQKIILRGGQIGADFDNSLLPDSLSGAFDFKATRLEAYIHVNF